MRLFMKQIIDIKELKNCTGGVTLAFGNPPLSIAQFGPANPFIVLPVLPPGLVTQWGN